MDMKISKKYHFDPIMIILENEGELAALDAALSIALTVSKDKPGSLYGAKVVSIQEIAKEIITFCRS